MDEGLTEELCRNCNDNPALSAGLCGTCIANARQAKTEATMAAYKAKIKGKKKKYLSPKRSLALRDTPVRYNPGSGFAGGGWRRNCSTRS